ncbi:unnamed protein product [Heligmosomoides polygyrus]|uniref:Uncharacterized protein n=1 Tax=Heligmosomoides polygyrus TaxID=6339 RepID=A0A3P7ZD80_HELPZ|nr:unnamed protein product [Heligmosomoides polygyrus]
MSEEMVAFFKKTIEHRKQRESVSRSSHIKSFSVGVFGVARRTFVAPDEEAKTKLRRENARQMYGASAERILAMETLIDMRFEQEYARKRPPLWPNIPLRL